MIFDNVKLLGYTHKNQFFGEKSFAYSAIKTLSVRGYILDLLNSNGVKNIFNGAEEIKELAKNLQNVQINNENYGTGKIKSLVFSSGNWVRTTEFTADIEIYQEVPLSNLGSEFTNVNLNNQKLFLLKSFSEMFDIEYNTQNQILGGSHKIDIEYDINNKDIDVTSLSQKLAQELLKTLPSYFVEGNYTLRTNYKTLKQETYDLINGKFGFTKSFSYSTNNYTKPFSIIRSTRITLDENGEASVEEESTVKAENNQPSLYDCALAGLNDNTEGIQNSYSRCLEIFNIYKQSNKFDISRNLNASPVNKVIVINKFEGTIKYNVTFDNDIKKANSQYTFERTLVLDRNKDWIWNVSEKGFVEGVGIKNNLINNIRYQNAETAWSNTIKNTIITNVTNIWTTNVLNKNIAASNSLKLMSKDCDRKPTEGRIEYDYIYSDDPTIYPNDAIRRLVIEKSDTGENGSMLPIKYKEYVIPNNVRSLIQNLNLKQQAKYDITIKADITLDNQNDVFNGKSYFQTLKSRADSLVPNFYEKYLESLKYETDEIEQNVMYTASYKYSDASRGY